MYDWRSKTTDPCDVAQGRATRLDLLSKRHLFFGRLIDFFKTVCAGKSVLHLGFVEHSVAHMTRPSWKHAAIASVAQKAVGIDIAKAGVEAARSLGYEAHVIDITGSERLDEKFDVVIAGDIIEHLMSVDCLYRFSIAHMRGDSALFVSTPNPSCALWVPDALRGRTFVSNLEHTCWVSPSQINEHAYRVGMKFKRYYPIFGGANIGPAGRALKRIAFRALPEFVASTNVYELTVC